MCVQGSRLRSAQAVEALPVDLDARSGVGRSRNIATRCSELTHTDHALWRADGNDKEKGRLNGIRSILDTIPYEYNEEAFKPIDLPERQTAEAGGYKRSGIEYKYLVKDYYS
ncbi:MAG: hypothetical protein R3C54_05060 [Parvularculaceae bacterium]